MNKMFQINHTQNTIKVYDNYDNLDETISGLSDEQFALLVNGLDELADDVHYGKHTLYLFGDYEFAEDEPEDDFVWDSFEIAAYKVDSWL